MGWNILIIFNTATLLVMSLVIAAIICDIDEIR
jgi:hypothetical protein